MYTVKHLLISKFFDKFKEEERGGGSLSFPKYIVFRACNNHDSNCPLRESQLK